MHLEDDVIRALLGIIVVFIGWGLVAAACASEPSPPHEAYNTDPNARVYLTHQDGDYGNALRDCRTVH